MGGLPASHATSPGQSGGRALQNLVAPFPASKIKSGNGLAGHATAHHRRVMGVRLAPSHQPDALAPLVTHLGNSREAQDERVLTPPGALAGMTARWSPGSDQPGEVSIAKTSTVNYCTFFLVITWARSPRPPETLGRRERIQLGSRPAFGSFCQKWTGGRTGGSCEALQSILFF